MGESVSIYLKNDDLLEKAKKAIEEGEYRNMSHAVEAGLENVLGE